MITFNGKNRIITETPQAADAPIVKKRYIKTSVIWNFMQKDINEKD